MSELLGETKTNFLMKPENEDLHFAFWRTAVFPKLGATILISIVEKLKDKSPYKTLNVSNTTLQFLFYMRSWIS